MSVIVQVAGMLKEEKKNNLKMQEEYNKEIAKLPKGSIVKRNQGHGEYYHLCYYCNETKKSVSKYIGKDEAIVTTMQEQIEERRQLEKSLRNCEKELEAIEKMLKIANKFQEKTPGENLNEVINRNAIMDSSSSQLALTDINNIDKKTGRGNHL